MKIVIKNSDNSIFKSVEATKGVLLSEVLKREGIYFDMPCGGTGRCGKCKVLFVEGAPSVTDADRRTFNEKELNAGYRLACRAVLISDAEIDISGAALNNLSQTNPEKLLDKAFFGNSDRHNSTNNKEDICESYGVALDIGTTTIVAAHVPLDNTDSANKSHNKEAANPDNTDSANSTDYTDRVFQSECTNITHGSKKADIVDCAGTLGTYKENFVRKSIINSQRMYGADVISRIKAANEGHAGKLHDLVLQDISDLIPDQNKIEKIILAGNTTMLHILMGDSCEGLGSYPYTPVRLSYPDMTIGGNCPAQIFDGISAFVGADIVSGMYALGFNSIPKGKKYMLIDLGTNGEMAVGDSDKITVCSTAAGPVFEGGGISCGMAGVSGAIEHVKIEQTSPHTIANDPMSSLMSNASANLNEEESESDEAVKVKITVIGDQSPIGLCGSGVLETVSELRRCGITDETGLLSDTYFEDGFPIVTETDSDNFEQKTIVFTQNDIRAVQLAKAAIRSGIDTLLSSHGCKAEDIDRVFLAGGFSEHLDFEKVRLLKMLPEGFFREGVLVSAGNTSLKGCIKALNDPDYKKVVSLITNKATEIPLAAVDTFSDSFVEAMNF